MNKPIMTLALGVLLTATPLYAKGASNAQEAIAEFEAAMNSGLKASTREDAMMCTGYWLGLKELYEIAKGETFFKQLSARINAKTMNAAHQYWAAVVREHYKDDPDQLKAAGDRVVAYYRQMLERWNQSSQGDGKIVGVFNTLGSCANV